ncbi:uroporphyrinogen-III synthase [Filimonas effusa]|uniref:Uroporphyrinogen-III synthase n=1 Tax=Filimonas effusa TaxID=2508721 RepID=A0A4Q1D4C7_9BACT|nr:uroporphyrinogen-III synthase [Filimonas effusa]RXK83290.1 uroporphyrinogen-III synthase [Filimonas effusa]
MQAVKSHILCTRSLEEPVLSKAAAAGVVIDTVSFIETQPVVTEVFKQTVTEVAANPATIVFTSMNAVDAVVSQLEQIPTHWHIYCIGGITKELVKKYFGEQCLMGTGKSAALLAEKISHAAATPEEVVFFCGDQRLDELPQALQAHQIKVREVVSYTTILTPQTIDINYDAVIFFSPSAAHSFFSENTVHTDIPLFAIGKTTAATIRSYVANTVITSEWPGKEHMIDLVIEYFNKR